MISSEPITDPFGFPLLLRTATKIGFKNAKWITSIEVTNDFPETYYGKEGFNDDAHAADEKFAFRNSQRT